MSATIAQIKDRRARLAIKLYPWYAGLSSDLFFLVPIQSVWLTSVKGLDAAQMTSLATISSFLIILLHQPLLWLVHKLGNTTSLRLGSLLFLLSNLLYTFGQNYWIFVLASTCMAFSAVFRIIGESILKHALMHQKQGQQYVKLASRGNLIYAVASMCSALIIGTIFAWWQYLPMFLGIAVCIICLILSFFITDVDKPRQSAQKKEVFPKPICAFIALLVFYSLVFGMVSIGQSDGNLLLQGQLELSYPVDAVAAGLSTVFFISRLLRISMSFIYPRLHRRFNVKMCIFILVYLFVAVALILCGFYWQTDFYPRFTLMALGFIMIPTLRDPLKVYSRSMILDYFPAKHHNRGLVYLSIVKYIGEFIISSIASLILLNLPVQYVFIMLLIATIPLTFITQYLLRQLVPLRQINRKLR